MSARNLIRNNMKTIIKIFDGLTRWIPTPKYDVLIITDFEGNHLDLLDELDGLKVKWLKHDPSKALISAFYVRRSQVIYVDNINIVIGTLNNIDATIIQFWHATSAIKKFGLATVTDEAEFEMRAQEMAKYDLITVNSEYMADKFKQGFGVTDCKMSRIGCVQSKQLFQCDEIKPYFDYIVYAPTFRWDSKYDKQAIEFIKNFKSDKYKLIYSLHPKLELKINNEDAIDATGTDIRSYFAGAKLVISDYSSLLIDASLKCNSVVMYAYDRESYEQDPGLYIDQTNFWGYYTESEEQLISYINQDQFAMHDRQMIKDEFFTYDDFESVHRVAMIARNLLK